MPDLKSILERESRTVEAPDDFERLVRRRDRRRRNGRIGAAMLALVLAGSAIGLAVRAFQGVQREMPAAPVLECPPGAPDEPGPFGQNRPRGDLMRMAFDRDSGRIVLFDVRLGEGPARTWDFDVWTFDVCTNRWRRMQAVWDSEPLTRGFGPGWTQAVYDSDSDLTVAVGGGGAVFAYDLESDTLTQKGPSVPEPPFRLVYDPGTGLILAQSLSPDPEMWTYDVENDTWARVRQDGAPFLGNSADHELLAYDGSVDRVVGYLGDSCSGCPEGDRTAVFDPRTGVWVHSYSDTPDVNAGWIASGGEVAYDEAAERTVVFGDGFMIAYDATADRWEALYGEPMQGSKFGYGPLYRLGHWMVYDPLNERLVVYGGNYRTPDGWVKADDVWAFDLATNEWIQLLEPSEPYPEGIDQPS